MWHVAAQTAFQVVRQRAPKCGVVVFLRRRSMKTVQRNSLRGANLLVAAMLTAGLMACGGGGSDEIAIDGGGGGSGGVGDGTGGTGGAGGTDGSGGTGGIVTRSGVVAVNGPVRNAVVCLDLNANSVCDTSEPASAPTDASGAYTLSYDTSLVLPAQSAAASLIAPQVPGAPTAATTTIDEGNGEPTTDAAYVLRQVPGKAGAINPLTTLVAAGVAKGMTEAVARANVTVQLQIAEAKIDDYQGDPIATQAMVVDSARTMAGVTATVLASGIPLVVGNPVDGTSAGPNDLRNLHYTDASNFSFTSFDLSARPAGASTGSLVDIRQGRTNGLATASNILYGQAYLTAGGWRRCDESEPVTFTLGVPNRSVFCGALEQTGARASRSLDGRSMADVVTELQSDPQNFVNIGTPTGNLLGMLGAAVFPVNSTLRPGVNLALNQPIFINNLNGNDGISQATATNLDQLIAARPASGAALPGPGGSLSLGLGRGNFKNLRVAFTGTTSATAGAVQFYECDLDSAQNVASNCAATNTGGYTIRLVYGVRVMRFTGNAPTVMNHERVYAEVKAATQANAVIGGGDWVFIARQNKPDLASNIIRNTRLNGTAWQAMKTQLGI
jgi:hypothetical protein